MSSHAQHCACRAQSRGPTSPVMLLFEALIKQESVSFFKSPRGQLGRVKISVPRGTEEEAWAQGGPGRSERDGTGRMSPSQALKLNVPIHFGNLSCQQSY